MNKKLTLALLISSLMLSLQARAYPEAALVPGGIALLGLPDYKEGTEVTFDNKPIAIFPYENTWIAMAGIPLDAKPGDYQFSIKHNNGVTLKSRITVKDKKYDEQHLTIKNKRKVNPSEEDMVRIGKESIRKKKAKTLRTENTPKVDFIWPAEGRISSVFGLRRFFNEQERKPHNGLDIAAITGTPVKAAADGTVIDAGDFFFSGNMIFIDHGQGIISLYAHMNQIDIKPGDSVKQGEVIGTVGATGRATGPHLHFAVFANKTLIDPIYMLPKRTETAEKKHK
ncbi:MAG: peptidoglycan DD-metalloendopeptidase family protein [Gammaproteobacteria bacterium]|nr:peptidoglycan DD-metalloendopeptidase family protein [Gammaproteobacteria bacterium]